MVLQPSLPLRLYIDTSVYGGCFDAEFAEESNRLFRFVRSGHIVVLSSDVIVRELHGAPVAVRDLFASLPPEVMEVVQLTRDVIKLRDSYLTAGIVDVRSINDATHVALATTARADAIVSWNFRHIVRLDKIRAYNQVNLLSGYGLIAIVSPREVQFDVEE